MEALGLIYLLTRFLTLNLSGNQENKETIFIHVQNGYIPIHPLYVQTLILVNSILVNLFSFFKLLETVFSVVDHILTQDSQFVLLTVCGNTGLYIDQGG